MFTTLISATLVSLLVAGVSADFTVVTPEIAQCGQVHISWSDSSNLAPYDVAIVAASDPCNDVLVEFGEHNSSSLTWGAATLSAGKQVILSILDSDDNEAWSGTITVGSSNDTSCLTATNSSSSSAAVSSPSAASAADNSAATTLVVGNTAGAASNPEATPDVSGSGASTTGAVAAGAANAGILGSGAISIRPTASLFGGLAATVLLFALAF